MCSRKCWIVSFFYFFLHLPHRQFSFRREVLNHHTPPPIPKLSSITKTRILFVFLPKKVPVFCLYFYKNEPVWRIRHTALSDFSLNPSIRQLLIHCSKFSMYAWGEKVKVWVFRECLYVYFFYSFFAPSPKDVCMIDKSTCIPVYIFKTHFIN